MNSSDIKSVISLIERNFIRVYFKWITINRQKFKLN